MGRADGAVACQVAAVVGPHCRPSTAASKGSWTLQCSCRLHWFAVVLSLWASHVETAAASLLTAAIQHGRTVAFKDCMRRSSGSDEALQGLLRSSSRGCRKVAKLFNSIVHLVRWVADWGGWAGVV
eukprot:gb/GFBE01001760.1/.p2 GENE.gb/GFBE01001760.1/~~gb/GFBE01001760.1/.p2  ORF type:complete len:126 (-),score=13.84 gb/GFBE01001760.1/:30-407(-)